MISQHSPLGLGSASPRRRALLETLGIPLRVMPVDVDEQKREGERADAYLARVVRDKLEHVLALEEVTQAGALLVADTIVLSGERILGKPTSPDEARATLAELAGGTHEVHTRFAIARTNASTSTNAMAHEETVKSLVLFRPLAADEISRYVATGEGADKAGGYAIQGVGSFAVSRIEGSYANVVGLPVCEVVVALQRLGLLVGFP